MINFGSNAPNSVFKTNVDKCHLEWNLNFALFYSSILHLSQPTKTLRPIMFSLSLLIMNKFVYGIEYKCYYLCLWKHFLYQLTLISFDLYCIFLLFMMLYAKICAVFFFFIYIKVFFLLTQSFVQYLYTYYNILAYFYNY